MDVFAQRLEQLEAMMGSQRQKTADDVSHREPRG